MRRAEIIERLEKAEGASRELDLAILPLWEPEHEALRVWPEPYQTRLSADGFSAWKEGFSVSVPLPRFTASLDAAIALVEITLPGWLISICQHANKMWQADLVPPGGNLSGNICASGLTTAPIALLCCLFRALEAKEAPHG